MPTIPRSPRTQTFTPIAGLTGPFHVAFRVFEDDALTVYDGGVPVEHEVIATYSDGYTDTARVVLAAPTTGAQLRIDGDMKPARDDDYVPTDPNLVQNLNIELGRVWAVLAELKRDTQRSARSFTETAPFNIAPGHVVIQGVSGFEEGPDGDAIAGAENAANRAEAAAAAIEAGLPAFQNLPALKAYSQPFGIGTTVETLREGFAYEVVPSASHVQTAAPAYLRVLNRDGIYSIKAFGAKGDGATDDTAAVQAAVNEAGVNRITFDKGDYRFSNILVPTGVEIAAVNGSSQVTASASGTPATGVKFSYYGDGGVGSRLFTFRSPNAGEWIRGGGIVGRPHLTGNHLCETLIDAQSMHGSRFDVEMSRATHSGLHLNGRNGVLSQFNKIDAKYVWGSLPASQNSFGIVLHGDGPTGNWVGCTQNHVVANGLVHNGDMVGMVGHCDNNKLDIHASVSSGGTGNSLAMYPGNAGKIAHVNKILYACNDIYMGAGAYGNVFDFTTSEGARLHGAGAGLAVHQAQVDYITGKTFESPKAPLMREIYVPASAMRATGAASAGIVAGTPVVVLPKSGEGGAAFSAHDPIWGAGTVTSVEWLLRSTGSGNALIWGYLTATKDGQGLTVDVEFSDLSPVQSSGAIQRQRHSLSQPVEAAGLVAVHLTRRPASSFDTCAAQVELIGAVVRIDFSGPSSLQAPNPPHRVQV